jgi:adenylyltransferase/sulfurtransferase
MFALHQERYARLAAVPEIGWRGQARLTAATVVLVGCGGLGTVSGELLARAGVGHLRLVDGDRVEMVNLAGQGLYDEEDARSGRPKVLAAADRLRAINPTIYVEPVVTRLTPANADQLLGDAHLVLDGTDNFATRYLINQVCVRRGIPWVYAGVTQSYGMTMNIVPGETSCFACIFQDPGFEIPEQRQEKGVLPAATHVVASFQVGQAIKVLVGDDDYSRDLLCIDIWAPAVEGFPIKGPPGGCPVCGEREQYPCPVALSPPLHA